MAISKVNPNSLSLSGELSSGNPLVTIDSTGTSSNEGHALKVIASGRGSGVNDVSILSVHNANGELLRVQNAGGISFNGDTASANALDDYEEGTWTPTYSMSGASFNMSLELGAYVKVGRMVNAVARVRGQRVGGSGILAVSGLPFTTNTTANLQPAGSIGFTNGWSNSPKGVIAGANSTLLSFKKSGSSSALSNIVDDIAGSDVSTSSTSSNDIILSITYMTS